MNEPLVLIPGLKSDHRVWQPQIDALAASREIIVATQALQAASIDAMAEALLDASPPRFALAGMSMGGYVALAVMRRAGARVTRLALLCTSARADTPGQTAARRQMLAQAQSEGLGAMARATVQQGFFSPQPPDGPMAGVMAAMTESTGLDVLRRQVRACEERPDARAALSRIACPTLVACGREDAVIPAACGHEIAASIGPAALHELPECGHVMTLDRPEAVSMLLRQWLASSPAA